MKKICKETEIKSAVLHFLANHRVAARTVTHTTGLFTRPIRDTNAVMIHAGRCGSTVVGMLLNQHPKIRWLGEIFARFREKFGRESWVWGEPELMIKLRTNFHLCNTLGVEIKRSQMINLKIEEKRLVTMMNKLGYEKFILLERKNYLKKKISEIVAEKMGKMNTSKEVKPPKVRVPIKMGKWDVHTEFKEGDTLVDHFGRLDTFYGKLKKIFSTLDAKTLSYEEDVKENPKIAATKISNFLGLEEPEAEVETKKINRKSVTDSVENLAEVEKMLSGTKYEWMMHD